MKTYTFIFTICAISALAFFGCAKKQVVSKTEIAPIESAETQSEPAANAAVAQETQIAKDGFDAWSDEEAYALAVLMKRPKRPDGSAMPGENPRTAGLFIFTYHEGDRRRDVPAPVVNSDWYEKQKSNFENYQSVKQEEFAKMDWALYASSAASIIAFHEKDTPRNIITILFSADKWKSWNESRIELDPDSLDDGIRVSLSLTCPVGESTGYLLPSFYNESESRTIQGRTLYRTRDLGKSWEVACALPEEYGKSGALFAQGDTIIAPTSREGRYFSFFKSADDGATWKRIELPLDTERYKAARFLSMSMDGNYGYVEVGAELRDESEKNYEEIYFATKDGGETWVLWNNKRKMFVI